MFHEREREREREKEKERERKKEKERERKWPCADYERRDDSAVVSLNSTLHYLFISIATAIILFCLIETLSWRGCRPARLFSLQPPSRKPAVLPRNSARNGRASILPFPFRISSKFVSISFSFLSFFLSFFLDYFLVFDLI